jgi:hypothetical protein
MILYKGQIYENKDQQRLIDSLFSNCLETINSGDVLLSSDVIEAVDKLILNVLDGKFDSIILPLLEDLNIPKELFLKTLTLFNKESLEYKVSIELDTPLYEKVVLNDKTIKMRVPLGILMHIAAGNVDGLPAFSVIEGLLAGNINILKLPISDNGVSILLLSELIKIEPKLKDYIYVFDIRSTDLDSLKEIANISDAVIIWGGDEAVRAGRTFVPVNKKIITYGHKLSFAYSTLDSSDTDIINLLTDICITNQLLCSSPQGIFVDTDSDLKLNAFAVRVDSLFKKVEMNYPNYNYGMFAKNALTLYTNNLDPSTSNKTFSGTTYSIVIKNDTELELSLLFRNIYIKKMPRNNIITNFKKYSGYLQTCYLLSNDNDYDTLSMILSKTGIVKILKPDILNTITLGESHDGLYPLLEYTKVVEVKK